MLTFLVNLDKNKERLAFMDAELRRLGIEYERTPAVYGKSLSNDARKRSYAPFRAFCATGRPLRPGEIGCAMSHCEIYRAMAARSAPIALVLEDDVILDDIAVDVLARVEAVADVGRPQVFMLSALCDKEQSENGIERIRSAMGADCYVITAPAARIILEANSPVVTVADSWARWVSRLGLELYRVGPTCARQVVGTYGTDINERQPRRGVLAKILLKCLGTIGRSIDWTLFKLFGK